LGNPGVRGKRGEHRCVNHQLGLETLAIQKLNTTKHKKLTILMGGGPNKRGTPLEAGKVGGERAGVLSQVKKHPPPPLHVKSYALTVSQR